MCVKSPHDLALRRLFINVVERDKFPPTFGPFKDEANRRVFPFVRRFLEWAVNFLPPGRFFSRLAGCETLDGIGLAFKDLVIPSQEILLVLYDFYPIGHRQWEFRHIRDRPLLPAMTADLNFFQNVEKSVCAKALGNNNRIKSPANQVRALTTRDGRQARIGANEFDSDALTVPLITVFSFR